MFMKNSIRAAEVGRACVHACARLPSPLPSRVNQVWMDEYKQHFYTRRGKRYQEMDYGDISERVALRKK